MQNIIHIVSNKEWGGGEQYVLDLASRQKADGIAVTVVCKPVEAIRRKYEEAGLRVLTLPLGGVLDVRSAFALSHVLRHSVASGQRPTANGQWSTANGQWSTVNGQWSTVNGQCSLHAHNFKDAFTACYARRLSGHRDVRVVMCRHLTRKGKNTLLYRWLYRQLDCLCFDSGISKQEFLSTRPSIDERKLRIVHTSVVVPKQIEAFDVRGRYGLPSDAIIAMSHGRLDPEKGLDTLLEAMALLRNGQCPMVDGQCPTLVLLGRGSEEYTAHLKQKATELGLSVAASIPSHREGLAGGVIFAGFQPSALPWIAAADVGILASTVSEGCPLSPQEYMSLGHPVIVTDNGGQREYVIDCHNGLLVPPGDAQALAAALARLAADAALRQRLGQQAKADFYDHLDYEHFYQQIKDIYLQ